jgi:hypothetical protein
MLAYGVCGDLIDEYLRMSKTRFLDTTYKFCKAVIVVFGDVYSREPNASDTVQLLPINEALGLLGYLEE